MTKNPQPLSDGYNVNSEDEEVYNWLVKFDSGETSNNDGVTQWAICELALERIKKDAQDSYESNFESATLDWVEWRDGVIAGKILLEYWKDRTSDDGQDSSGRVVEFIASNPPVT